MGQSSVQSWGWEIGHPGTKTPGSERKTLRNTNSERPRPSTTSDCLTFPRIRTFSILTAVTSHPIYRGQLHQQHSFIRCCSIPFTYRMEGTTGQSFLSPGVWNAAPLGTVAELGLLVCNEGQSGRVISAGEAGRWARCVSHASSHTCFSLCKVGIPPASPTGLSWGLINVCRHF